MANQEFLYKDLRDHRRGDGGASDSRSWLPFDGLRAGMESVYEDALA